jgi:hypothetical protein
MPSWSVREQTRVWLRARLSSLPLRNSVARELMREARFSRFRHQHRRAQTTKWSQVCPSVEVNANANFAC